MSANKPALLTLKILIPVLVLAISAWGLKALIQSRQIPESAPPKKVLPVVEIRELRPTEHVVKVTGEGVVQATIRSDLTSQVSGRVEFVSPKLEEGRSFIAGELLMQIETADYAAALAQSHAALQAAELHRAQTQKDADVAKAEWERMKLDREPDPLLLRIPQLAEARARLAAAQAAVKKSELDLERCQIKAPYDGRVLRRHLDIGEFATPGMRIAELHSIESAELRMPLHDSELQWLELPRNLNPAALEDQPKVELRARFGGRDNVWYGFVDRVAGEIDPGTRMVELIVRVPEPFRTDSSESHYVLPLGLFVEMQIEGSRLTDVYAIPRASLRRGKQLLLVDDQNRIQIQDVEVLIGQGDQVLVRGLRPGSRLCVTPLDLPVNGMEVRLDTGTRGGSGSER
jgi:multidrug efflux system membrane fusion protein